MSHTLTHDVLPPVTVGTDAAARVLERSGWTRQDPPATPDAGEQDVPPPAPPDDDDPDFVFASGDHDDHDQES